MGLDLKLGFMGVTINPIFMGFPSIFCIFMRASSTTAELGYFKRQSTYNKKSMIMAAVICT